MKRTTVLKSAAVLGVASLALAACGGSSSSDSSSSAAPAESSAAASPSEAASSEAPAAAAGTPLYLVDGNTGNALGEKLPAGTLNGVKGTIPGAENTQDFKDALLAVDPELVDFAYAPESYDAVILAALAAAKAKSDAGVDMAKEMVAITNGTEICNDYAGCLALLEEGKAIDYNGRSGAVNFWDAGDPTSASIGVYQFGPDNVLLPEVTFMEGEIVPEGDANPIEGEPQKGANDGTFTVGTLLPITGSLAFLGPPEVASVQLAIKDIEAAGGIPGFDKIMLEEGDSGDTSTDTATQTVNRLLGKNVDVIIGAASSGVTLSTLDLVTSNGVLQISPANTSPELTTAPDSGLYWRTAPSDVLQGAFVGSLVLQDGYTKVAIMSLQDSYGDGLNANVTKAITEGGGEIVANVVYDPKSADFSADVAKIKAAGPEAIVLIGFDESAQIITELVKQGIGPNVS
ncbi:MAG: branched-chain amino acid transport system substrate-binding protein [Actinomycetota bacterium]|jgi:ABC-type branched-subunit amino acid transport system substrate-binding protein|nr:branched-chain amino acid transport system substrate-binding protein [Actinomycetota bacterium]